MTTRLMALALIGGLIAAQTVGQAQDKPPAAAKSERTLYAVRHGDAADLAVTLAAHFEGEVKITALPVGNGLLISGPSASTAEVVKLLEQVDKPAKTVEVEVTLVEVTIKKGDDGADPAEPEFAGTPSDVRAKLDALAKAGQVSSLQRIKLTTVDGQAVTTTTGGNKPVTTSTAVVGGFGGPGGGGPPARQRSVSYSQVGASIKLTARVGADSAVGVDLAVNDSRVKPAEAGDDAGAAAFETTTLTTRVTIPAGRAVTAQAVRTNGKTGKTIAYVIVSAKVGDSSRVARR